MTHPRQLPCGCTLDGSYQCDDHRPAGALVTLVALSLFVGTVLVAAAIACAT